jgi:large subunit ribosomal protein L4
MTTIKIYGLDGATKGEAEVPDTLFASPAPRHILHDVVRAEEAAGRQGTASTKTRSDVSGGGKKPWKQKGTGRARHGSTRSPIWRHGGVVFGPHPRDYDVKVNRKVKRQALAGALTARFGEERVIGLDPKGLEKPKTATMAKFLAGFEGVKKPLFLVDSGEETLRRSIGNLDKALVANVGSMSARSILIADLVILSSAAIEKIKARGGAA